MSTSQHTLDKEPMRIDVGAEPLHHRDVALGRHEHPHWSTEQLFLPKFHGSRIANPSPLAFSAVAVSLYLISMVALKADDLASLSIIVSTALGYSSVALLVAVSDAHPVTVEDAS